MRAVTIWRALAVTLVLAVAVLALPAPAAAETETWAPPVPKGVVGADGVACHGEATQDGHTYIYTNYIGADAGEMAAGRERAWQMDYCRWMLEQDMGRWFLFKHGVMLDPANIRMTVTRL